jgi:hypothetical protein
MYNIWDKGKRETKNKPPLPPTAIALRKYPVNSGKNKKEKKRTM